MDLVAVLLFLGIFISAGFALAVNYLFPTNATLEQAMVGMIFAFSAAFFKHLPGTPPAPPVDSPKPLVKGGPDRP